MTRQSDTEAARAAADEWAAQRGLPPSGGYSGQWYVDGYLGGWWPDGWPKWWANYGIPAGSILGGQVVGHQYASTPVDMDVMLESEIVSGGTPNVDDQERQAYEDKINGLVSALGYVAGDVVAPLRRPNAAKYVKAAVAQIDAVADQQGIAHG